MDIEIVPVKRRSPAFATTDWAVMRVGATLRAVRVGRSRFRTRCDRLAGEAA